MLKSCLNSRAFALAVPAFLASLLSSCAPDEQSYCDASIEIVGTEATDHLNGGPGDECIYGQDGNDILSGGDGNDVLDSGPGSDAMQGGLGDDTFVVNLGDHMDMIADSGGQDTIQFGRGVTLNAIAARMENNVISIQIEGSGTWTYVMLVPGKTPDESIIERFVLPGNESVSASEFLASVSQDVLPIKTFMARVVEQRTVNVSETDPDSEIFGAVLDTVRSTRDQNLCVHPALSPRPDELEIPSGRFRPEEYYAVFFGQPDGERATFQRKQFQALASVGIMWAEAVVSPGGVPGEKFSLTIDGWSYMNQQGCIHYGTLDVREIASYLPTGRKHEDTEIYAVKATVKAKDVELWAQDPTVRSSFPKLAQGLVNSTMDTTIFKNDSGWVGADRNGMPLKNSSLRQPNLPMDRELLSVEQRTRPGTLGSGSICIRPPILGQGGYDDSRGAYATSAQDPYRGGNVEFYEETKAYLDMLVSIGAATSGPRYQKSRSGLSQKYLEYTFSTKINVRNDVPSRLCIEVATTKLELLHAQWISDHLVQIKGQQTTYPAHAWVRNPSFLAAHPDVAKQLGSAQPVIATVRIVDGQPPRMEHWAIP